MNQPAGVVPARHTAIMPTGLDDGRDLSYLHCQFLDPADYLAARAWLTWTPPRQPKPLPVRVRLPSRPEQQALLEWSRRYGFDDDQRRQWVAAGLSSFEAHVAEQCVRVGLTPADLSRVVDGRRVAWWLRSGESAGTVHARLANASDGPAA